jgi:hypothetical protein
MFLLEQIPKILRDRNSHHLKLQKRNLPHQPNMMHGSEACLLQSLPLLALLLQRRMLPWKMLLWNLPSTLQPVLSTLTGSCVLYNPMAFATT